MKETEPVDHDLPGHNWTLKKLKRWLKQALRRTASNTTLRRLLKAHRLSWKKCQKALRKANPEQRAAFIERFAALYEQLCREEIHLLYVDEAHLHRDMDLGYTWATVGEPAWRVSSSPSLADRINWYGGYDFNRGQSFIWNEGACNQANTVRFLHHLADWLGEITCPIVVIWDGAPWHRARLVQEAATELGFFLLPLPAYSPDLNPIEGLWKWMREEVTRNHCHPTMRALFDACKAFIERINADPHAVISRLWPKFDLDPTYEELLVSN